MILYIRDNSHSGKSKLAIFIKPHLQRLLDSRLTTHNSITVFTEPDNVEYKLVRSDIPNGTTHIIGVDYYKLKSKRVYVYVDGVWDLSKIQYNSIKLIPV